jgi:hypothetical protein
LGGVLDTEDLGTAPGQGETCLLQPNIAALGYRLDQGDDSWTTSEEYTAFHDAAQALVKPTVDALLPTVCRIIRARMRVRKIDCSTLICLSCSPIQDLNSRRGSTDRVASDGRIRRTEGSRVTKKSRSNHSIPYLLPVRQS